ncbi:DUF2946 domain-containing protein [Halopseudomonas sp.]|uniref:DUF2946 domain-containing protein n=1 Tax=Halopseudomonas sp. TaxID=2901191 RepID=UPI0030017946
MTLSRDNRLSIALALYLCTLFSVLTCGFHQGQMSGLQLSGAGIAFCNAGSHNQTHRLQLDPDQGTHQQMDTLGPLCPLCSSVGSGIALNSLGWSLYYPPAVAPPAPQPSHWARPPPRAQWPALNPRASPVAYDAAGISA